MWEAFVWLHVFARTLPEGLFSGQAPVYLIGGAVHRMPHPQSAPSAEKVRWFDTKPNTHGKGTTVVIQIRPIDGDLQATFGRLAGPAGRNQARIGGMVRTLAGAATGNAGI